MKSNVTTPTLPSRWRVWEGVKKGNSYTITILWNGYGIAGLYVSVGIVCPFVKLNIIHCKSKCPFSIFHCIRV